MLRSFNLSGNKSLRTLEITARSIDRAGDIAPDFLKTVLSSVPSSAPLDVVIIYQDFELCRRRRYMWHDWDPICFHHSSQEIWARSARYYHRHLEKFREMYGTRDFRLILCADVVDFMVKHAVEILQRVVEAGKAIGGFSRLYEPLIISERRTLRTRHEDHQPGCLNMWYVPASTL